MNAGPIRSDMANRQHQPPKPTSHCDISQVHQILIVDGFELPAELPDTLAQRIAHLKRLYADAHYTMWTGETLRAFIKEAFDNDVLWAFDYLKPYSYKSDLGRLCLLYAAGGLYSDIMLEHRAALHVPIQYGMAAFRQAWRFRPYTGSVSSSLIWSTPGRPEWRLAIDKIVVHCRERFYGEDCVEPTGPWLFGRACAAAASDRWRAGQPDDQWMGVHSANGLIDNMIFHTPGIDSQAVAMRPLRPRGDWTASRLAGTNDYSKMWEDKAVYGA